MTTQHDTDPRLFIASWCPFLFLAVFTIAAAIAIVTWFAGRLDTAALSTAVTVFPAATIALVQRSYVLDLARQAEEYRHERAQHPHPSARQ